MHDLVFEPIGTSVATDADVERVIASLGENPTNALVIISSPFLTRRRDLVISLAARHRVPTIYPSVLC
jgi:putative tryptophan/tyrosine transport system substrate-binding protein